MPSASVCPICSAPPYGCDHDGLRWSYIAGEFEECLLVPDAMRLAQAVDALLLDCWARQREPSDPQLVDSYREGLALIGEDFTADDALFGVSCNGTDYARGFIEELPGVVMEEEFDSAFGGALEATTQVFWVRDLDAVRDAIEDRVRALEIEMARE